MTSAHQVRLLSRIEDAEATIAVIGLGFIGRTTAIEFSRAGYDVLYYDIDANAYEQLVDVASRAGVEQKLTCAPSLHDVARADIMVLCLPSKVTEVGMPDLSAIESVLQGLLQHDLRGKLLCIQSTIYPEATSTLIAPMLQLSGLTIGTDIFLGISPERLDLGNDRFDWKNIPKVVTGFTPRCAAISQALFKKVVSSVISADVLVAEVSKCLENTFRLVNVALIDEVALICADLHISTEEVLALTATKPFGFFRLFEPGPGIGGECVPVVPHYLRMLSERNGFRSVIGAALAFALDMPTEVAKRICILLKNAYGRVAGCRICVCGIAYKRGVADTKSSPSIKVIAHLEKADVVVDAYDPLVSTYTDENGRQRETVLPKTFAAYDMVFLLVDQPGVDIEKIKRENPSVHSVYDMGLELAAGHRPGDSK